MNDQYNKKECNNNCIREDRNGRHPAEIDLSKQKESKESKPRLLLHSCCGPCSTSVVEQLIRDYEITVFFYNPNITDKDEYLKRKKAQESFINIYNLNPQRLDMLHYKDGPYEPAKFYESIKGFENEKEGGARCAICFRLRLEKAAEEAMLSGCDFFTTTLSVSPHKDFDAISKTGSELSMRGGAAFLSQDFKKKDGYKRSIELSKSYDLYRQNYCGCEFSK